MESNEANIELIIKGENIKPENFPINDLLEFLQNLNDIISTTTNENTDTENSSFSLVGVREGSTVFCFVANNPDIQNSFNLLGQSMKNNNFDILPESILPKIEKISSFINRKKIDVTLKIKNNNHSNINKNNKTTINEEEFFDFNLNEFDKKKPIYCAENDVLYGEVKRIGGKTPKVWLATENYGDIFCTVKSEEILNKLANKLYKFVGVEGIAKWNITDNILEGFEIKSLLAYEKTSITQSMQKLTEIIQNDWDNLNPDEVINDLRY